MNSSSMSTRQDRQRGDKYIIYIACMVSIAGFLQGYIDVISLLLIQDRNFLEYITIHADLFAKRYLYVYYVGEIIGALISSRLSDSFGRRPVLLCFTACLAAVVSWMATSTNDLWLLIARFLTGVIVAVLSTTAVVYIAEMAPPTKRGRACGVFPVLSLCGSFTAVCVSYISIHQSDGWRLCVAFPVGPALIFLLCMVMLSETPWWLVAHKTPADGLAALEQARCTTEVASEFNSMYRALAYDARHENSYKQLLYSDLSMRYRVGVMTVIHIAHAILGQRIFAEYGVVILRVIEKSYSHDLVLVALVLIFIASVSGAIVGCDNIDEDGRRHMLLCGLSVMTLFSSMAALMVYVGSLEDSVSGPYEGYSQGPLTSDISFKSYLMRFFYSGFVMFYSFAFYVSIGVAAVVLPTEVFPLRARAKAVSLVYACNFAGVTVYKYASELLLVSDWSHFAADLWTVNALLCVLCGVYIFLSLPETTGIVFEDSDALFDMEDYDMCMGCCPRGSGSGFLGLRTMSQSESRFQIFQTRKSFTEYSSTGSPALPPQHISRQTRIVSNKPSNRQSSRPSKPLSVKQKSGMEVPGVPTRGMSGSSVGSLKGDMACVSYDHKYSETMRLGGFQYLHDEETLQSSPLFNSNDELYSTPTSSNTHFQASTLSRPYTLHSYKK